MPQKSRLERALSLFTDIRAGEGATGEQEIRGSGHTGDSWEGPVTERIGHDTASHLHDAVLGVMGHESDIAMERESEPDSDGVAVDRGDDRFADTPGWR